MKTSRGGPSTEPDIGQHLDARVRRAVELMRANYAKDMPESDVARRVDLSVSRFAHLFTQQAGAIPLPGDPLDAVAGGGAVAG